MISTNNGVEASFVPNQVHENPDEISTADLRRWFLNLFPCRLASVIRRESGTKWLEISRFHNLTDAEIIESLHPKAKLQRGYRFDPNTMFLVLQIPVASPYHNAASIAEIREHLEELSIKPRHYQFDDDWYLHIYLAGSAPSARLARGLQQWCISKGYELGADTLLVHPSEAALPFPLQHGFTFLNERCQLLVRRDELDLDNALIFFLQDAGKSSVDPEALLSAFSKFGQLGSDDDAQNVTEESPVVEPATNRVIDFRPPDNSPVINIKPLTGIGEAFADLFKGGNVVSMEKYKLGDDLVSVFKDESQAKKFDNKVTTIPSLKNVAPIEQEPQSADGSRLVIFDENTRFVGSASPTSEIEAVDESQLLLFPVRDNSSPIEESIEPITPKKRRRARQQGEPDSPAKSGESNLPTTNIPEA